jgi:hypothetical protein
MTCGAPLNSGRNRHPNGTYELANQFSYHFDVPATEAWATGDKAADKKKLKSFIYFSQVGSPRGLAVRSATCICWQSGSQPSTRAAACQVHRPSSGQCWSVPCQPLCPSVACVPCRSSRCCATIRLWASGAGPGLSRHPSPWGCCTGEGAGCERPLVAASPRLAC